MTAKSSSLARSSSTSRGVEALTIWTSTSGACGLASCVTRGRMSGFKPRKAAQPEALRHAARVVYRLVETGEDVAAVLEETLTGWREGDASWASLKELDPDSFSSSRSWRPERRLGGVQTHPSRFAETAFLGDGYEIAQMPKFQFAIPVSIARRATMSW